jgi:Protein of unknown function (DUF3551)
MKIATSAIFGLLTVLAMSAAPVRAEVQYPWCAQYRSMFGATNCGFVTYRQCMETISGVGGICTPNPAYDPPARPKRKQPTY